MIKFVHFKNFNNSQCVRRFPDTVFAIHAWPILEKDLDTFKDVYYDGDIVVFDWDDVADMKIFVAPFPDVDAYVCGRSDTVPTMTQVTTPVDMTKYAVIHTTKTAYCHCGCGRVDGEVDWFENPYQVIIIPRNLISDFSGIWISDRQGNNIGSINYIFGRFSIDTYRPDYSDYKNHATDSFFDAWQIVRSVGGIFE